MKGILAIMSGLGVGAALMYLFDPEEGNRRRSVLRDKAMSMSNKAQGAMSGRVQDLSNRAKGLLHETKSTLGASSNEMADNQPIQ
jgi:hypothetical protein